MSLEEQGTDPVGDMLSMQISEEHHNVLSGESDRPTKKTNPVTAP